MNPTPNDGVVRITRDEALSEHVDDMLKRQMSLRGEPGVTRDHGRRWYYQNWFIFALVGTLAATLAWGLLEPYFDDMLYLQGPVETVNPNDTLGRRITSGSQTLELRSEPLASFTLRGQRLWLLRETLELRLDGTRARVSLDTLQRGEELGVYVEYLPLPEDEIALARFVIRAPPPATGKATLSLQQLHARHQAASLGFFAVVAGLVGLLLGAADGLVCRLPRRALLCGAVGLVVGLLGGFISGIVAELVYAPLTGLAMRQGDSQTLSTFGFLIQMSGRALAWALAGMTMGLGQGIALRSKRLLLYGLLGGVVGGLLGGLVFDPIDLLLLGQFKPSAHWSRLIGLVFVGLSVGAMIGVVELLARDAWLRMTQGPLAGKEFILFKDVMQLGRSPRSDLYLFNDPLVAENHAVIRTVGDDAEIENLSRECPVLLNERSVRVARLRHGDQVTVGRTIFVYQRRRT